MEKRSLCFGLFVVEDIIMYGNAPVPSPGI